MKHPSKKEEKSWANEKFNWFEDDNDGFCNCVETYHDYLESLRGCNNCKGKGLMPIPPKELGFKDDER